jgi:hypothetical protein
VVLHASSWESAQRGLDLIEGCHQLLSGCAPIFPVQQIAHNGSEPVWMQAEERKALAEETCSTSGFPLACAIAAKATRRRIWMYAVAEYKFSSSLFSVHHVDLEPRSAPQLRLSTFPGDHIIFSHAIMSAYSVIEDLGLEVRASSARPSRIGGEWNPEVKADLEKRLKKAGINLRDSLLWTMRGPKRKIEIQRPVPGRAKAPWSSWDVRDCEIDVIDAIAHAGWLRSCVASHGVKRLTPALSPYDVINVQHLARRLLLERLGFWRWYERTKLRENRRHPKD